ncbi:hypothetical protein Y10_16390 [Neptunitalea sp. Y10]|uniref:Uncharacterized protein n=1 Tax=Neptunitalea lumnitzerae TaxID=2965509 RepID=A0ABQ5MIY6_9FLAO|nr:hypothetical protein Y10_16390 [Neptunitalea sp. Y10]
MKIRLDFTNLNKVLLLNHIKEELIKYQISKVILEGDKLLLKNNFFNNLQSNLNPFAYTKKGVIYISNTKTYDELIYNYNYFKFPLYLCIISFVLIFIWNIAILIFLYFSFMSVISHYLFKYKQKKALMSILKKLEDGSKFSN